jgi:hypothetical protein
MGRHRGRPSLRLTNCPSGESAASLAASNVLPALFSTHTPAHFQGDWLDGNAVAYSGLSSVYTGCKSHKNQACEITNTPPNA